MKKLYISIFFSILLSLANTAAGAVTSVANHTNPELQTEEQVKVFYNKNLLHINGLTGNATIEIYNMLGKKVADFQNIEVTDNFSKSISLPMNNIFIVSVQTENFKKTFKIVTK